MSIQPRTAGTGDWIDAVRFASPRSVLVALTGLCALLLIFVGALYVRAGHMIWQSAVFALFFPVWIARALAYVQSTQPEEQPRMTRREAVFVAVGFGFVLLFMIGYGAWFVVFAKQQVHGGW